MIKNALRNNGYSFTNYKFDMASTEDKQQPTARMAVRIKQTNRIHSLGQGSLISETELANCTTKSLVFIPFDYSYFFHYILLSYFLRRRKKPTRCQSIAATKWTALILTPGFHDQKLYLSP